MTPLTLLDWLALIVFAGAWIGYSSVVDRHPGLASRSVIAAMDEHRRRWHMLRHAITNPVKSSAIKRRIFP